MPPIPAECTNPPRTPRHTARTRLCFTDMEPSSGSRDILHTLEDDSDTEVKQNYHQPASIKRSLEQTVTSSSGIPPSSKRRRMDDNFYRQAQLGSDKSTTRSLSPVSIIIRAVEKLSTQSDVIADGTRNNTLPTVAGKHRDLNAISPETMSDVLNGVYTDHINKVTIIDCRYPYEYDGGHIQGAVNLYTRDAVKNFLHDTVTSSGENHVLIFHCEFSSERGPKMYRHLRSLDRELNRDAYPRLNFPEIYLLEGGYKAFFHGHKELCFPVSYKPMLHKDHSDDLRHFRVKSKSWSAGDKPRHRSRLHSGLKLGF